MGSLWSDLRSRLADISPGVRLRLALLTVFAVVAGAAGALYFTSHHRPPRGMHHRFSLTVSAVSEHYVELRMGDGWTKTVVIDETTRIHDGATDADATAITPGRRVVVNDHRDDEGRYVATDVELSPPDHKRWKQRHEQRASGLVEGALGLAGLLLVLGIAGKRRRRRRCDV